MRRLFRFLWRAGYFVFITCLIASIGILEATNLLSFMIGIACVVVYYCIIGLMEEIYGG